MIRNNFYHICIIVPVHNRKYFTIPFLNSIYNQNYKDFKIIIVDDGSTDGTYNEIKKKFPSVDVIPGDGHWWWTKSVVKGIEYASKYNSDYILLLNNDLVVNEDYLYHLVKYANKNPDVIQGSMGVNIDNKSDKIFPGHIFNRFTGLAVRPKKISDYSRNSICLPGRGLWIPQEVLNHINFDYKTFPQYAADYDFTLKAGIKGFRMALNKHAIVYYHIKETGYKTYFREYNFRMLIKYLSEIKSTCCLQTRANFCKRHCYLGFKYISIIIDSLKCILGYFRRWIFKKIYFDQKLKN